MSLTNSPKFDDEFEDAPLEKPPSAPGEPSDKPPLPPSSRHWTHIVIAVLAVLVVVTAALLALGGGGSPQTTKAGSATIRGQVVNAQGQGVVDAIVYVEGMQAEVTTDQNGGFSISSVPDGPQMIVVGVTPEAPRFVS